MSSIDPDPTLVPTGRFTDIRQLIITKMSRVYLARDEARGGETVVLKHISFDAPDPEEKERKRMLCEREVLTTADLRHPNIVRVLDHWKEGECTLVIELEYVEGPAGGSHTLADEIERHSQPYPQIALPAEQIVDKLLVIARTIQFVHGRGILHYDLKPSNILLTCTGDIKITDFGIARPVVGDPQLTYVQSEDRPGTRLYMAPEQLSHRHRKLIGEHTDVYGIGAILYEMLTGCAPFVAYDEQFEKVVRFNKLVPPSRQREGIPKDLETICLKCLEVRRHRYDDTQQLIEDLERYREGRRLIHAHPPGIYRRSEMWLLNNWRTLAFVAIVATIIALLAVNFVTDRARQQAQTAQAELTFRRGVNLSQKGDLSLGHLLTTHAWQQAPLGATDLRHAIRTSLANYLPQLHALENVYTFGGPWPVAADFNGQERESNPPLIRVAVLDRDHKQLLVAMAQGRAMVFDPLTGTPLFSEPYVCGNTTGDSIAAGAFSPDGRFFVVATNANGIHVVRRTENGDLAGSVIKHNAEPRGVCFTSDGKQILVASRVGANTDVPLLCAYDVETRTRRHLPIPIQENLNAISLSPDGTLLATGGEDRQLRLWNAKTGDSVGKPMKHPSTIFTLMFSPDGQMVATGCLDRRARVWTVPGCEQVGPGLLHRGPPRSLAFSADNRLLLTGSEGKDAQVWDIPSGLRVGQFIRHPGEVRQVQFLSPAGAAGGADQTTHFLTAGWDDSIRVWRLAGPTFAHFPAAVSDMAVRRQGGTFYVAAGCREYLRQSEGEEDEWRPGQAQIWDSQGRAVLERGPEHAREIITVALSPDGKQLLAGGNDRRQSVRLWDVTRKVPDPLHTLNCKTIIRTADFHPNQPIVACGGLGKTVQLWDTNTGQQLVTWNTKNNAWIWNVRFITINDKTASDKVLLLTDGGPYAELWEIPEKDIAESRHVGKTISLNCPHTRPTHLIAQGLGAQALAPGGPSMGPVLQKVVAARVAEVDEIVANYRQLYVLREHPQAPEPEGVKVNIRWVVFDQNRNWVLTCSGDKTGRVWDARDGRLLASFVEHVGEVMTGAFHPTEDVVATGSVDNTARVWDAHSGAPVTRPLGHDGTVLGVAFSPDGRLLATACDDGTAQLWRASDGLWLGSVLQHQGPVNEIAFPDGKTLLTISDDGTLRYWPVPSPLDASADPSRIIAALEVLTGTRLNTESLTSEPLEAKQWQQRRREVMEQGWPPALDFCEPGRR